MDLKEREKRITKTSIIGIIANCFLAGFKALVGLISGSIAIVLDAVNNLTDAISSIITIIGVKLAKKKPDNDHPFGHGRVEYFSAIIIAIIILSAGVTSLIESVKKIINPEMPDYSTLTLVIVSVAVIVKFFLGKYVKSQGVKYNSDALIASGNDASFDSIISLSTLVGALITIFFNIVVDGYLGALIALFIIKAGIEMLLESVGDVMGTRPDSEVTIAIKKSVKEVPGVIGAYDLVLHNYGPNSAMGSIHVEVPGDISTREMHKITMDIQNKILDEFHIFLTVGLYAVDKEHEEVRNKIKEIILKHDGTLGCHGFYIDDDEKFTVFDVAIDFTVNKNELNDALVKELGNILEGYKIKVNFDTNFSD